MNNKILKKIKALNKFDTPTICNGLELIDNSYRLNSYTKYKFFCLRPKIKPIVGFAKTAKISSLKHSYNTDKNIRINYYEYVNKGDFPKISVIQDIAKNPIGSFWGEVNANIHNKLGCLGVVTNGSVRDLDAIPIKFQLLSKTISPSHAEVSLINYSKKVDVMGMKINDGDLIHADIHGAVKFDYKYVDELYEAISKVSFKEKIILDSCKKVNFSFKNFKKSYLRSLKVKL